MRSFKNQLLNTRGQAGGGLVMILTAVNLLVTLGIVGVLYLSFQKDKNRQEAEDIALRASEEDSKEKGEGHGGGGGHGGGHGEAEKAPKKHEELGKMINLDQFTVNLSAPGSTAPKYLRINISLELPNEEVEAEVNFKIPQVRNTIIDLVNSKRSSDLATVEGREFLKEEIKSSINSFLVSGKVKGVFFTSFALHT
ncbi:MAG: flagellar basal body-associated FliL family protein [Bdellovibrionia bacterium]